MSAKKKTAKEKWGKPMVFVVEAVPYKQECVVVVNGKIEDAIKFLKKQTTENAKVMTKALEENIEEMTESVPKKGAGVLFHGLPVGYLMMFNHDDSWIRTVGMVTHESFHFVDYVLKRAGIKLSEDSDEAYTYLLEHVVTDILKELY